MNKKLILVALAIITSILVMVVTIFVYQSYNPEHALKLPITNIVDNFDPAIAFHDDALILMGQSIETLYQYHYLKRPYEVIEALAEKMPQIVNDGKTYIIKIKQGIYYHPHPSYGNKRELIAQDFINQMKRLVFKPLKSSGEWGMIGKVRGAKEFQETVGSDFEKLLSTPLPGIGLIDKYTLKIDLVSAAPNFLYFLTMPFTSPVPEELLRFTHNDLSKVLVGTGPYILKASSDGHYTFERFKQFRLEQYPGSGDRLANLNSLLDSSRERLPFLDNIDFKVIPDEEAQWDLFFNNDLDIISVPKKYLGEIVAGDEKVRKMIHDIHAEVKYFPKLTSRWLGFNMHDPVIGGKQGRKIRKAIAFGFNRDEFIQKFYRKTNLKANSIFNPSVPGYDPRREFSFSYDLEKAKEIMRELGHSESKRLTLRFGTRGNKQENQLISHYLKQQFAKFYIDLIVETQSFKQFIKRGRSKHNMQVWIDAWIYDYPDAENMLQLLISSNTPGINKSRYKNLKIDRLFADLAKTYSRQDRIKLMEEIEEIVNQELPWIMIMYETDYTLQSSKIMNFRKSSFIRNYVKYLKKIH